MGTGAQSDRQQRLLVTDLLSIVANVQPIIVRAGIISEDALSTTLEAARAELSQSRVTQPIAFAFGLRP